MCVGLTDELILGEYDWSCPPEMSQKTADKIAGGKFQAMKGLGHFPATENPKVFVGYGKSRQAMGKICPAIVDADRVTL